MFLGPVRAPRLALEEGTFDALNLESIAAVARRGQRGRDCEGQTVSMSVVTVNGLALAALRGMPDSFSDETQIAA